MGVLSLLPNLTVSWLMAQPILIPIMGYNNFIARNVKEPRGLTGYVAAWYVTK
jgi:hypothetical protein